MSVYKRKGRWYCDISAGQSGTGRRERHAIPEARTKSQAERAEAKIRTEIFEDTYGRRAAPVFTKFVEDVYLPWSRQNKRSARHDAYRARKLCEFFKGYTLSEVSPLLIEKFKRWRAECTTHTGGTVRPGTINNDLALLSRVFSMAVDGGHLKLNPCSRVRRLRVDNTRERYLSDEEETKLMPELPEWPVRVIVRVALGTGMRLGEVLTLTEAQLDFGRGLVSVTNTKTGRPRTVPMTAKVRAALQDALRLREVAASDYLFPGPYKPWQPISDYAVRSAFKAACARVGVAGLRFHDLRHTAATRMAEGGAPMVDIRAVLGHSDINMTARYAHSTDEGKRRAVEATERKAGHKLVTSKKFKAGGGAGK